jgi:AcrR family transcriptional regulator
MQRPTKRKRISAGERRQRILEAGAVAFATRGYHATSVQEIAAAAGVTKPVFYDHFGSKEEIFVELTEGARDELIARGSRIMAQAHTLEERVRVAWDVFFQFVEEQPTRARVLLVTPLGVPELEAVATRVQDEATRRLAHLLIAERGLLPRARDRELRLLLCMEFIKCGMHGLARWWARHPDAKREDMTRTVVDVAWRGLSGLTS